MSKQLTLSSILAIIAMGGFAMLAQGHHTGSHMEVAATETTAQAGFGS